jgi:hypothetical protein
MKEIYTLDFRVICKNIEAWSENQIEEELPFAIGKAISDNFGLLAKSRIEDLTIQKSEDGDFS